ncbi:hypothetical protein, partial [Salmonella enterica]
DNEERKILFFTNNHLLKGENSKKHLRIIYEFMKKLRINVFFNIDPYIHLDGQEAIDMIKTCLIINTPLTSQTKSKKQKLQ